MGRGMYSTTPIGKRVLQSYKTRASAQARATKLNKKGYTTKLELIMGNWLLWVSPKYFRDHPKVKGYYEV